MAPSSKEGFSMAVLRMYAFQLSESEPEQEKAQKNAQKKIKKSEPLENVQPPSAINGQPEKDILSSNNWTKEVAKMKLRGAVKQLAANCFFDRIDNNVLYLKINSESEHQMIERAVDGLNAYLISHYQGFKKVLIQINKENGKTLAGVVKTQNEEQIIMNESRASSDPVVQEFVDIFDATIEETK
jgi:hypothetical protein